jgi:hypothetical protein
MMVGAETKTAVALRPRRFESQHRDVRDMCQISVTMSSIKNRYGSKVPLASVRPLA